MTMTPPLPVQQGMQVVGSDLDSVGTVKEVRPTAFLVNRAMQRDLSVPYNAIQNVSASQVVLTIPAKQVDSMGWSWPSFP
jgi:hypothetical protein